MLTGISRPTAQGLDDIIVTYDQSQLLSLPRPAAEIIIGNPVIADVSVQSGNLLVITGKSFGITNMIALDAKRQIIFERRILVKRDEVRVVNLQRGDKVRQTFNCTPQCNPTITVGDDTDYFETIDEGCGEEERHVGESRRRSGQRSVNRRSTLHAGTHRWRSSSLRAHRRLTSVNRVNSAFTKMKFCKQIYGPFIGRLA